MENNYNDRISITTLNSTESKDEIHTLTMDVQAFVSRK